VNEPTAIVPNARQPHGERIAIIALDLQTDFLADDARMPVARSHVEAMIAAANAVVEAAVDRGVPVAYVRNEFLPSQRIANLFRRHAAVRGTPGVDFDPRVRVVSDVVFAKSASSAFTNPELEAWLRRENVGRLFVTGVFVHACVRQTVLEALRRGYAVCVVSDAVGGTSDRAREAALAALVERGATATTAAEVGRAFG
jgi:nicotinamidase-related amidase